MKHIDFYLDFISPYAYLAFEQLPQVLEGLSYEVSYRPVLLGAIVRHHGQRAPAEIAPKRAWTYRHVLWLGHAHGIPIDLPATHPYNPLPHLRLALAASSDGTINRHVAQTVFHAVWRGGAQADDPARLEALAHKLPRLREPDDPAVKAQLRANTDAAIAAGVFGTPAFGSDGHLFWGFDSLPMLRASLTGDDWFEGSAYRRAGQRPAWSPPDAKA